MATVAKRPADAVLTPGLDDEHRLVAWQLMRNGYTSCWRLGYVAARLLWAMALALDVPAQGQAVPVLAAATVFVALALVTIVMHRVFLGLTSMSTGALDSGSPRFDPIRSARRRSSTAAATAAGSARLRSGRPEEGDQTVYLVGGSIRDDSAHGQRVEGSAAE